MDRGRVRASDALASSTKPQDGPCGSRSFMVPPGACRRLETILRPLATLQARTTRPAGQRTADEAVLSRHDSDQDTRTPGDAPARGAALPSGQDAGGPGAEPGVAPADSATAEKLATTDTPQASAPESVAAPTAVDDARRIETPLSRETAMAMKPKPSVAPSPPSTASPTPSLSDYVTGSPAEIPDWFRASVEKMCRGMGEVTDPR